MPQIYEPMFQALDMTPEERAWLDSLTRALRWWLVLCIFALSVAFACIAIMVALSFWAPPELRQETEGIMGWAPYLGPLFTWSIVGAGICGRARSHIQGEIINFYLAVRRARENRD